MNLNRAALITALSLASKVTKKNHPILEFALIRPITRDAAGPRIELVATNLETFVLAELPHTGAALSAPTLAPVAWLLKLLKTMDGDEVVMDRNTVNAITMYEGSEADPKDFPTAPDPWSYTDVQIPGLTDAMQYAYDAASVDPQRFTLNHVQVVASKKEVNVNATDGHRLYRAWIAPAGVTWSGMIPSELLEIAGASKKLIQADQFSYGPDTSQPGSVNRIALRVKGQGWAGWVIGRSVEGTFPNCESVTPKDSTATVKVELDPTPTMQVLKQAIALSKETRPAGLDLVIRDGGFFIHPAGRDIEIPVPGANTLGSPNMIIGINGHYLRSALLNLTNTVFTLRAQAPGTPIWFTEGRGKAKRTIVIMPMRTNYTGPVKMDGKDVAIESLAPQTASN